MLGRENPLPAAVAVVIPKLDFRCHLLSSAARPYLARLTALTKSRMDDSWFARLAAHRIQLGRVSAMIGISADGAAVAIVIGNSDAPEHLPVAIPLAMQS